MTAGAGNALESLARGARPAGRRVDTAANAGRGAPAAGALLVREQALALRLVAEALDRGELRDSATAVVTEIATALNAARVSLGVLSNGRVELVAISNSAEFDRKSNLVRAIESALAETCGQDDVIRYPDEAARLSSEAHAELARTSRSTSLVSLPLVADAKIIGALMVEHSGQREMDGASLSWLSRVTLLLAPILQLKLAADMPLSRRAVRSATATLKRVFGPRRFTVKLSALLLAAVLFSLFVIEGTHRVTATAALEPGELLAVVAPVEGYIDNAFSRAGDIVSKGDRLASLDTRDMELERAKWQSELGKLNKEYGAALAARNRNQQRILQSRQKQVHTQLQMLESLIQRAELTSPIDGVVVTGDLSESFGSPVDRGELLFEVAPLDSYRLLLNVEEWDVAGVAAGQKGRLLLAGKPDQPIDFEVKRISPVSRAEDGANTFRVEAQLHNEPDWIRPGMTGAAKIVVGTGSLAWIYSHKLTDVLRLRLWQMGL